MSNYPPAQQQPYMSAEPGMPPAAYAHPGFQKPAPTNTTVADTNTYALVAIILAFAVPLAGIIFGHLGLGQIKRTGDAGRGLALTALIFGYIVLAFWALLTILYIGFFAVMFSTFANSF